jgi:sporulation protein YlmC with PRC-barrel domain
VDLVRDLLDTMVVDRNGRELGRVDSIIIERREGAPPRVSALEIGPAALGYRLHPFIGRMIAGVEYALGFSEGRPVRIEFSQVLNVGEKIKVDVAVGETAAGAVEQRLRRVVSRIPGA